MMTTQLNCSPKIQIKQITRLVAVLILFSGVSVNAEITDPALQACIDQHAEKHQWHAPEEFTQLICHNRGISSLSGLEAYSNLNKLSLHKNKITAFEADAFEHIEHLNLGRNRLRKLAISDLAKLRELFLFNNKIETLSLTNLSQLQQIKSNSNAMVTFTYQNLPKLSKIYLFDNELEDIDISSLPALSFMDVRENPMPDELYEDMDRLPGVTMLHDGNAEDWDP